MIKVGASTEIEMKEKKARVEDALHATRAAVEEGVVPGGGVALIRALAGAGKLKGANEDQNHGIPIALRAMEAPLREIVTNAGEEPSVVLNKVVDGSARVGAIPIVAAMMSAGCGAFFSGLLALSHSPFSMRWISPWMAIIASQKRSSSALDSLSVGSTISVPATGQRDRRRVKAVIHQPFGDVLDARRRS